MVSLFLGLSPVVGQDLDHQIRNLRSAAEVEGMWASISTADQAHRGLGTVDSIDNLNFKRMVLLIKHHGYPTGSITPNVVFTHQRSAYIREHYFPILHQAYLDGKADAYWFMHNVKGLHRGRFGFDLVQPSDSTYERLLARLSPYLNGSVSYDLGAFDSLYTSYIKDVERIISARATHRWVNAENDRVSIHHVREDFYFFKLWSDGSYGMPQRIHRNPNGNKYTFVEPANKAYLIVDTAGNLTIKGGQLRPQHYSVDGSH
jgi:hypothetical protein